VSTLALKKQLLLLIVCGCAATAFAADSQPVSIENEQLSISSSPKGDVYEIRTKPSKRTVLRARVAAEVDQQWIASSLYPTAQTSLSSFSDRLGSGQQITTTFTGLPAKPNLVRVLRLYKDRAFGTVLVKVQNMTGKPVTVQAIRSVDAEGSPIVDLEGPEDADRVLSDSFSEDRPTLRIYNLADAPDYAGFDSFGKTKLATHLAVGSQLIYNRQTGRSLFLGTISSSTWLTILRLGTTKSTSGVVKISSYIVESTGTTEIEKRESLHKAPSEDQIELSIPAQPGREIASEPVLFAAGADYHAQLERYGAAIRILNKARVTSEAPSGWWSWIDYDAGITEGYALTNSQWLAEHLLSDGYKYVLIDEGYQYARGEYITADATHFPHGMQIFGRRICDLGLRLGVWTAPFEVSERSWVYQHHKEWLVHNASGKPIRIDQPGIEPLYVLDATHPGAQEYLRQTYRTLAREWGVRYVKLDFMDDTAIEGYHFRPDTTAMQAQRTGLEVIRGAVGEEVLIDKDGSPMLNPVGIVDEGRVSTDTSRSFDGTKTAATGIAARYYMNRNFFNADPDAFALSGHKSTESDTPLSLDEAEAAAVLAALAGGMFDIGSDLTVLSGEPERLALAGNRDLLQMVALSRAAVPVDLMSYSEQDQLPSLFLLKEDGRQAMLAVFNWSDVVRSRSLRLDDFGLPASGTIEAQDALHPDRAVSMSGGMLELHDQRAHSVCLLKLTDTSVPAMPPSIGDVKIPSAAEVGVAAQFSVEVASPSSAVSFGWNFGDGTSAHGRLAAHAYTRAGTYSITVSAEGIGGLAAHRTASITVKGAIDNGFHFEKNRRFVETQTPAP
jgi:alpha-galactosidase